MVNSLGSALGLWSALRLRRMVNGVVLGLGLCLGLILGAWLNVWA